MEPTWEEVRREARAWVQAEWRGAVEIVKVPLASINRVRPAEYRYCTKAEVVREFVASAGACSTFAVNLGLLTPEEDGQFRREFDPALRAFLAEHPALQGWDAPCPYLTGDGGLNTEPKTG